MFRVIRMMNSVGPGATGVKKERERERKREGERQRQIEREGRVREKQYYICTLIMYVSHYKQSLGLTLKDRLSFFLSPS